MTNGNASSIFNEIRARLKDSREMKITDIAGGGWFHIYGKTNVSMRALPHATFSNDMIDRYALA